MLDDIFLSICIPSYNRPDELFRLLKSIDISEKYNVEVVICEDNSPKRIEIREKVDSFKNESKYCINYVENETNLGYDANLRQCILNAHGKWLIYMGDDDVFVQGKMNNYIEFLLQNENIGYVLRSYQALHMDGKLEKYKYYDDTKFFEPGFDSYVTLFRKSVFISGFTFRREYALPLMTNRFDGSLLYQLYIQAEICMKYPSVYYGIPITQSIDGGIPYFGNSESEKAFYTPGKITIDNSVNFIKKFFTITQYMDEKYMINSTEYVKNDMSKYSYPILSIQRNKGIKEFCLYEKKLREIGIGNTIYYKIYFIALLLLGEKCCDFIIRFIKKVLGKTPKL